jgi:hypothetical protein
MRAAASNVVPYLPPMSDCAKRGVHPHPLTREEMAAQVDELLRHQLHTSSPCGPRATLVDQSSENVSASDVVKVVSGVAAWRCLLAITTGDEEGEGRPKSRRDRARSAPRSRGAARAPAGAEEEVTRRRRTLGVIDRGLAASGNVESDDRPGGTSYGPWSFIEFQRRDGAACQRARDAKPAATSARPRWQPWPGAASASIRRRSPVATAIPRAESPAPDHPASPASSPCRTGSRLRPGFRPAPVLGAAAGHQDFIPPQLPRTARRRDQAGRGRRQWPRPSGPLRSNRPRAASRVRRWSAPKRP